MVVSESFKIVESAYGKAGVKILHVSQQGSVHTIRELEVETSLTLNNHKDYERGDNSDIIATDTQKNTVYILAKQYGISSPEEFGLILANHFISKYPWVVKAKVTLSAHPWQRVSDTAGRPHNHAFVSTPLSVRVASVLLIRGQMPVVSAGIRNLRVLKTTQSAFVNFVSDEYRSLPDFKDRLFSTIVTADWTYGKISQELDFDSAFSTAHASVLEVFAGPADKGIFSPSVQNSQFLTQKMILEKIPQVEKISISMPNVHYFGFDLSKFPRIPGLEGKCSGDVYLPVDKPSGQITSTLARGMITSKL
eukprot:GFUD01050234.1.p1 GENE.GFUD01050234.1~~GFUD01050234.1.p1  ORF type:complete len:307 (-),score=97.24 GFUD01050234.1:119-1039(-)